MAQPAKHPLPVHCPDLIEHNVGGLCCEPARHAKRMRVSAGGQRRDDECAQVRVKLVGRNHHARTCLADLASAGWTEVHEKHFAASHRMLRNRMLYHFHSSASKRVMVGASSNLSSSRACARLAASPQPARGDEADEMTMAPLRATISTSSESRASASNGFGKRTPRELPMRTIRAFMKPHPELDLRIHEVITAAKRGSRTAVIVSFGEVALVCIEMKLLYPARLALLDKALLSEDSRR